MSTFQALNELSILAKFFAAQLAEDTYFMDHYAETVPVYEEVIPVGTSVNTPAIMFVTEDNRDTLGAFGYRLKTTAVYQIKAVVEGADFSLIADLANIIDRLFDWQNQINPDTQQPKCQQLFTDPDLDPQTNQHPQIMVMAMYRQRPRKFPTFVDGVNYCHQGGEYVVEYYQP